MPTSLGKNLTLCFTKVKHHPSSSVSVLQEEDHHSSHHPLPNSISMATSLLFKNYNSLFDSAMDCTSNTLFSSDPEDDKPAPPDFATVYASQRFFFSSPGRSNSIVDSATPSSASLSTPSSSSSSSPPEHETLFGAGIAVPTFSPDPYLDFRRSMQEMVEARDMTDVRANCDYLHELLTSYLDLNPKSTHKFIIGAFSDLLVTLMTSSPENHGGRRSAAAP